MRRLKNLWRMLMVIFFAVLVVQASTVLVQGPDKTERQKASAEWPRSHIVQATGILAECAENIKVCREREERSASAEKTVLMAVIPQLEMDGNGQLISAKTWVRAMYCVCPPEGMFG